MDGLGHLGPQLLGQALAKVLQTVGLLAQGGGPLFDLSHRLTDVVLLGVRNPVDALFDGRGDVGA